MHRYKTEAHSEVRSTKEREKQDKRETWRFRPWSTAPSCPGPCPGLPHVLALLGAALAVRACNLHACLSTLKKVPRSTYPGDRTHDRPADSNPASGDSYLPHCAAAAHRSGTPLIQPQQPGEGRTRPSAAGQQASACPHLRHRACSTAGHRHPAVVHGREGERKAPRAAVSGPGLSLRDARSRSGPALCGLRQALPARHVAHSTLISSTWRLVQSIRQQ